MKKLLILFMGLLLSGCFSTIKPAKQIDDNQKTIVKEEKKIEATVVEIEKNDKIFTMFLDKLLVMTERKCNFQLILSHQ